MPAREARAKPGPLSSHLTLRGGAPSPGGSGHRLEMSLCGEFPLRRMASGSGRVGSRPSEEFAVACHNGEAMSPSSTRRSPASDLALGSSPWKQTESAPGPCRDLLIQPHPARWSERRSRARCGRRPPYLGGAGGAVVCRPPSFSARIGSVPCPDERWLRADPRSKRMASSCCHLAAAVRLLRSSV